MEKEETSRHFLAQLGKSRLHPGGRKATEWLIGNGDFTTSKKVLNVACHQGTNAINLAKQYGCFVEGIDLDEEALQKAQENITNEGLQERIHVQRADAIKLPFADDSFDIVLNEAMLTMLPIEEKRKVIAEYFRVLKPNGFLLTQDIMLKNESTSALLDTIRDVIHIPIAPLTKTDWKTLFQESGFRHIDTYSGDMTLLSSSGLVYDGGLFGTFNILKNVLKSENREQFKHLFKLFHDPNNKLHFIAICSQK